jgi:hypothetical protein
MAKYHLFPQKEVQNPPQTFENRYLKPIVGVLE